MIAFAEVLEDTPASRTYRRPRGRSTPPTAKPSARRLERAGRAAARDDGPGDVHRAVAACWRPFFHSPTAPALANRGARCKLADDE